MGRRNMTETMERVKSATISVQLRVVDDYHVFTSDDLRGLYVASKDPRKAFASVPDAIQALVKADLGVDCQVEHSMTYDEFAAAKRDPRREVRPSFGDRDFIIHCDAA